MEQQNKPDVDEINLYELWKVLIKRKKIIIGLFLCSIILATIISFLMPSIYRGDAVLMVQPAANITAKEITDFVGQIDSNTKDWILPKTHTLITDLKLIAPKDSNNKIMTVIEAKDIKAVQLALSEIIDYINAIALVKSNVKEEQDRLLKRSTELSTVIASSSELLNTYGHLLKAGKLMPLGFNPIDLNKKIYDIKLEKFQIEQSIQGLKGGVEIARQMYVGNRPVKPTRRKNVMIAGMAGLFIGIMWAFVMEYKDKVVKENSA